MTADITRLTIELSDHRRIVAYPEGGCQVEKQLGTRWITDGSLPSSQPELTAAELAELLRRAAVIVADTGQRLGDVAVAELVQEPKMTHRLNNADFAKLLEAYRLLTEITTPHTINCPCDWCQARMLASCQPGEEERRMVRDAEIDEPLPPEDAPSDDVSTCPRCEGSGLYCCLPADYPRACAVCNGTGKIMPVDEPSGQWTADDILEREG